MFSSNNSFSFFTFFRFLVSSLVDKLVSQNVKLDNEESISYIDGLLMKISNLEQKLKSDDINKSKNNFTVEELVDLLQKLKSVNSIFFKIFVNVILILIFKKPLQRF